MKTGMIGTEFLYHPLTLALFTLVWEFLLREPLLRLVTLFKTTSSRRKLFEYHGTLYITKSFVHIPQATARESDNIIERSIEQRVRGEVQVLVEDPKHGLENLNANLIVIGSPRYNKYAEALQRHFATQFEYVFDLYEGEPVSRFLKILNQYGDEYLSAADLKNRRTREAIDYGILFHARLTNGKRVLWISGIHGSGTLGVYKYLIENPRILIDAPCPAGGSGRSWFFRIKYDDKAPDSFEMIKVIELIDRSNDCPPRRVVRQPKALICDLGNVIMLFDRSKTYRAIGHWLHLPVEEVRSKIQGSGLADRYERGELADHQFYEEVLSLFKAGRKMSFALFKEFWGDIFWPNRRMIDALKVLKLELKLVLLSNTNNLHFTVVAESYGDVLGLFEDRLVLSFREGMTKADRRIFEASIRMAGKEVEAEDCIYVDDRPEYVEMASKIGMKAIQYVSYPQFAYSLRAFGVYVP